MVKRGSYKKWNDKDESVQNVLTAIKNGLHRDSACAVSKVPRSTFYEWMKDDTFRTKVEDSEHFRLGIVEKQKNKLIQEGHRPAIEKELKSRRRNVYGDSTEINTNGTINIVLQQYSSLPKKD